MDRLARTGKFTSATLVAVAAILAIVAPTQALEMTGRTAESQHGERHGLDAGRDTHHGRHDPWEDWGRPHHSYRPYYHPYYRYYPYYGYSVPAYYYYCRSSGGYYPYVMSCPEALILIPSS